jgi:hypothetical protein
MLKDFKDSKGNTIAQFYDLNKFEKTQFPTSPNMPLQFGFSFNSERKNIEKHIHNKLPRTLKGTSEFIYVINGKMKVKIFDQDAEFISDIVIKDNQALLQFEGGHSFQIEKGTKFFEIKQGPYLGQKADKKYEDSSK